MRVLFAIICSVVPTVLFAQMKEPLGASCNSQGGRIEYLKSFTNSHYSTILSKIENLPPNQTEYFEKEVTDALKNQNKERFASVYSHPLYFAWQVRDSFGKLQRVMASSSISLLGKNKEDEIVLYLKVLRTKERLHDSLKEYIDHDSKRKTPYIENGYFVNPALSFGYDVRIEELVRCALKN